MDGFSKTEQDLFARGVMCVVGLDEAGMGPLAGPVVVGAVSLPATWSLPFLNDSKKLTPKRRNGLEEAIKAQAIVWAVDLATAAEINELGIRPATQLAYTRVLQQVPMAEYLLVDAWTLTGTSLPQEGIIRGDASIASIAAASILAKEERDRIMGTLHETYPLYGFDRHKGYGTAMHLEAIRKHGPCEEHRTSWGVFETLV